MYEILGIPPGLEDLHRVVEAEYKRKQAFRDLLRGVLVDFQSLEVDRPLVIANLGCRTGEDTDDIATCCNEVSQNYHHIAIDCDGSAIAYAKARHPDKHTVYIHANAAATESIQHYPNPTDLIILRHPEIWHHGESIWERNEDIWFAMVSNAWSRSGPKSQVLITTYNEKEYQLVTNTFTQLPQSRVIVSSVNSYRDQSLTRWNHRTDTENCPDYYLVRIKKAA